MKIIFLLAICFLVLSCNPTKWSGYDYSFIINNNTSDTLFMAVDMNYPRTGVVNSKGVKQVLLPNLETKIGKLGTWEGLFRSENDTILVYFVDNATEKSIPWDSVFTQNKYLSIKRMSQSEFINANKTINYP